MKKIVILSLFALSCMYSFLSAQEVETIYHKNGSVLNGYILEQEPGKNILFSSDEILVDKGLRMVDTDIYEINWNDISYIEKKNSSDLLLSGTNCNVELKNGKSYIGFIKEIYPGVKIKLKSDDEKIYEFNYSDIKTIETIRKNVAQPLIEQIYYKESIFLKNGKKIDGYIIRQSIDKSISLISNDTEIEIKLTDILKMRKSYNDNYTPVYDIVLQPGQYIYNNVDIRFQNIEPTPAYLYIVDIESTDIIDVYCGQKISIYANLIDEHTKISAVRTLKITRKEGVSRKENHYETFKMDDFVNSNIVVEKSEPTRAGTTKFSFTPYESGYYVLQVSNKEGFIIIRVN